MGSPEFRILGPLEVRIGEGLVSVRSTKQRVLLALLTLHGNRAVSADRLINDLWGDTPPADPMHSLQALVHQLRRATSSEDGESPLATQPPGYVLRIGPQQLDLNRFERLFDQARLAESRGDHEAASSLLRDALALWRGPALADLMYEPCLQPALARLEEIRQAALVARVDSDLALGRHSELIGELEELVRLHPLVERFQAQLMLALYRSGRQANALATYRAARDALADELGLEPSPNLQRLERAILQHDPELDLVGSANKTAPPAAPARSILVAAGSDAAVGPLVEIAEPLARTALARELLLARLVTSADELDAASRELRTIRTALGERGTQARALTFNSPDVGSDLVQLARDQDVDLLILDAEDEPLTGIDGEMHAAVLRSSPCDVGVLVAPRGLSTGSVVVPFGGSDNDWAALELGAWLASALSRDVKLLGISTGGGERDASRLLARASLVTQRFLDVYSEPVLIEPSVQALVERTQDAALVVAGMPERWESDGIGSTRRALLEQKETPLLLIRRGARPSILEGDDAATRFAWSFTSSAS